MAKQHPEIDSEMAEFMASQPVFFVATAPLAEGGHVNCSPKGLDSLRVLDPRTVAYADLTGSGVETIAHLRENGRIVLMFCAFQGAPKILRIHGQGEVVEPTHEQFLPLLMQMGLEVQPAIRAVIRVRATRVSTSCGFAVPLLKFEGHRDQLEKWAQRKGSEALDEYRSKNNARSIDGLAGLSGK